MLTASLLHRSRSESDNAITITGNSAAWIAGLTDPGIKTDVTNLTASGTLGYGSALQILNDIGARVAASGTVTLAEFIDLQTITANLNNGIATPDYVVSIMTQLVDGSPSNVSWTGGAKTSVSLGNLHVGSTGTQLTELIGKWFLGTDLPIPTGEGATASQLLYPSYQPFNQPLYGSTGAPAVADVLQGDVGDCELCSGVIETVLNHPDDIQSMFLSEGNGVYGVRFYCGGKAVWVTVNDQLPVYQGGLLYNGASTAIWADLLEKAYAQVSSGGLTGQSVANSYSNISADAPYTVFENTAVRLKRE